MTLLTVRCVEQVGSDREGVDWVARAVMAVTVGANREGDEGGPGRPSTSIDDSPRRLVSTNTRRWTVGAGIFPSRCAAVLLSASCCLRRCLDTVSDPRSRLDLYLVRVLRRGDALATRRIAFVRSAATWGYLESERGGRTQPHDSV